MKPADYRISLDILESQSQYSLPMKQGDNSRAIHITLREGSAPYEIDRECFAVFSGRKADGTVLENNCVIKGNTIIYAITPQTTSASGLVDCEIKLYGANNGFICSARFSIIVDKRVAGDEEIESTSEFSALTELYNNEVARKGAEELREVAEDARELAEAGRVKAELKRESNTTTAIENAEEATERANDIADTLQDKLDKGEFIGEKGDKGDMPSLDNVANAIKGYESGNIVKLDDISSIEHNVKVKVNGENLDPTTVNVIGCGKNLIPFGQGNYVSGKTKTVNGVTFTVNNDGSIKVSGTATSNNAVFTLYAPQTVKAGEQTVTLSGVSQEEKKCYLALVSESKTYYHYGNETHNVTAQNVDIANSRITFVVIKDKTIDATIYPQIEFGEAKTEFDSPVLYNSATPNTDGTCNVKSVSQFMQIFTDTAGVTVECEYNRDTEKVISFDTKELYVFSMEELNSNRTGSMIEPIKISAIIYDDRPAVMFTYRLYTATLDDNGNIHPFYDLPIRYNPTPNTGLLQLFIENPTDFTFCYGYVNGVCVDVNTYFTSELYDGLFVNLIQSKSFIKANNDSVIGIANKRIIVFDNNTYRDAFYQEAQTLVSMFTHIGWEYTPTKHKIIIPKYLGEGEI